MSTIVRQEEHDLQRTVFQSRHEGGLQAIRSLLYMRRDKLNAEWPNAAPEGLSRLQGQAKEVARLIALIDEGPKVREMTKPIQVGD